MRDDPKRTDRHLDNGHRRRLPQTQPTTEFADAGLVVRLTEPPPNQQRSVEPRRGEMLAQMADPLLAQSAIDRLHSNAHELIIDGESYRRRQRPGIDTTNQPEPSSPHRH